MPNTTSIVAMVKRITGKGVRRQFVAAWLAKERANYWEPSEKNSGTAPERPIVLKNAKRERPRNGRRKKRERLQPTSTDLLLVPPMIPPMIGTKARNGKVHPEDVRAFEILDAVWPQVKADCGMPRDEWRARNANAARLLFAAGKTPGECAKMMHRAITYGGRWYSRIRSLAKLQEHWAAIAGLDHPNGVVHDDDPNRVKNTVLD
jgi:hypothetical protein